MRRSQKRGLTKWEIAQIHLREILLIINIILILLIITTTTSPPSPAWQWTPKVEEMIGSLVSRLEPSTDCIVWRSHHDRNQDDEDNCHGQCATDDDDDVIPWPFFALLLFQASIAVSRSALGKIRRLLSCHHHLLVRFHYNIFWDTFLHFWDTFLHFFGTLFYTF